MVNNPTNEQSQSRGKQIVIKVLSNKSGSSPFSRKGLIVLEEKGLPYEQINTDPEHLPQGFGDLNPNLRTSLLIDGDKHVFESNNIVDYLLRTYPGSRSATPSSPPLIETMTRPEHHVDDALILVTIETVLNAAVNIGLFALSNTNPANIKPWGWLWERDPERIQSCLRWLDQKATPEGFAPGLFSIMDVNLMCAFRMLTRMTHEDWSEYKNLVALQEFFEQRPSIVKTDPGPPQYEIPAWEVASAS